MASCTRIFLFCFCMLAVFTKSFERFTLEAHVPATFENFNRIDVLAMIQCSCCCTSDKFGVA